jgi:hypothetical protein
LLSDRTLHFHHHVIPELTERSRCRGAFLGKHSGAAADLFMTGGTEQASRINMAWRYAQRPIAMGLGSQRGAG